MSRAVDAARIRDEGATIEVIMEKFGWCRTTAHDMISKGRRIVEHREHEREKKRLDRAPGISARSIARIKRDRKIADAVRRGELGTVVGKRFGVSQSTVSRACHANGVMPSEIPLCVDRKLSVIANRQREAWADPVRRARRLASMRKSSSGAFRKSKQLVREVGQSQRRP